jgi:3-oxoacyl-[acyl-carrier-protein] synthase III
MSCHIIASGAALPERVVKNSELAAILEVAPEWIELNSGIRERRWADSKVSTSDLATDAVEAALMNASMGADRIDYLIGCTISPDYQVPGIAPIVQRKLSGCRNVPAVDLRVGCCAILYSLQICMGLIRSSMAETAVCFGAEVQSKGLDLSRRSAELSMLFGDGAGALIVSREPHRDRSIKIEDILIATDGGFAGDLTVRSPGTANGERWIDQEQLRAGLHFGSFNGRSLILHAVKKMADAATEITSRNGISMDQIDLIIPHQANGNLLRSLCKRLSFSEERVIINLDRFGNTGGASAFLALWQAIDEERLRPGSHALVLAFGAGFTWGAALIRSI